MSVFHIDFLFVVHIFKRMLLMLNEKLCQWLRIQFMYNLSRESCVGMSHYTWVGGRCCMTGTAEWECFAGKTQQDGKRSYKRAHSPLRSYHLNYHPQVVPSSPKRETGRRSRRVQTQARP